MKLFVNERLTLLNVLAGSEGDITTLRVIRDLQSELSFTEEDHERLQMNFSPDGKSVEWKHPADQGKDIEVGPKAMQIIANRFKALSDAQAMPLAYLPVYERFSAVLEGVLS